MTPFAPKEVRYIKLGRGGRWAKRSLEDQEIHFGYASVPHRLCSAGDWDGVFKLLRRQGKAAGSARQTTREIRDFYTLGPECLWVTFAEGHLYWAFAESKVVWLGGDGSQHGSRKRRVIGGWRNTDLRGTPLRVDLLSSKLTQVAAFRRTICRVQAVDYLLRRINGIEEPIVLESKAARDQMQSAIAKLILGLHWADFETLVDLIFARSGWQRLARVGGTQRDLDLLLRQPVTGETAFVQVKSRASQSVFDDYLERFESGGHSRMFFICHSPVGRLASGKRKNVQVWDRDQLARMTFEAGLFDWLIDKAV